MRVRFLSATIGVLLFAAIRAASAGPEPIFAVGDCKVEGSPYDRMVAICSEVIDQGAQLSQRQRAAAFRIRGYSRLRTKDLRGAIDDLNQAVALNPADPIAFLFRAYAQDQAGNLPAAADDVNRSLQLRPDDVDTLLARAEILRRERLFDRAYADADRSIALRPTAGSYLARAEICFDSATEEGMGQAPCDLPSALADVESAKKLSDSSYADSDADALEGRIYEFQGQFREAYQAYEKGLEANLDCSECEAGENRIKARASSGGQGNEAGLGGQQNGQGLDALLARINAEIGRAIYYSGRKLLVTTALRPAEGGLLQIDGHLCTGLDLHSEPAEIDACRASNPQGADTAVRFAPADIDAGTIHMESSAQTYRVLFLCKGGKPCVARPDGQEFFPGAWMSCPDGTSCDRLVLDFASLLDQLTAAGPMPQASPSSTASVNPPPAAPASPPPTIPASPSATISSGPCSGNGCPSIAIDFDRCQIKNTGSKPVNAVLQLDPSASMNRFQGNASIERSWISPGQTVSFALPQGCPAKDQIAHFTSYLMVPPDQTSKNAIATLLDSNNGPKMPSCEGTACNDVALSVKGQCVWASNKSAKSVSMTIHLADQTIDLPLDGADAGKAGPSSDLVGSPKSNVDPQCASAEQSEKMVQDMAANGTQVPPLPELDAILARCAKEEKQPNTTPAQPDAYQAWQYDPFAQSKIPVSWAKLKAPGGCVPQVQGVQAYDADYR